MANHEIEQVGFNLFEYKGRVWELTYLNTDSSMHEEDRMRLCAYSIDLVDSNNRRKNVKGDGFEGFLTCDHQEYVLGAFCGKKVQAAVETERGKKRIEVLVCERMDPNMN